MSPTETGYTEKYIAPELFDSESGDILFWLTAERDVLYPKVVDPLVTIPESRSQPCEQDIFRTPW